MAIVNNPHNIQDIDKQYKTWAKLTKPKGFVYRHNLLSMSRAYLAKEWWPTTSEGNIDKATPLKQSMFNDLKRNYFDSNPDINDGSFTRLFYKNDEKQYYFSIHIFTIDELSKPNNMDKDILLNDALFEIRLLDGNEANSNIVDSIRINCDLNTNYSHRSNNPSKNVLPEKFVIGCYNATTHESFMIESDRIYLLNAVFYLSVYGLTGDFVNITSNPVNIERIASTMISLESDYKTDEAPTVVSTDSIKVPKVSDSPFFTDNTKQRNAVNLSSLPYSPGSQLFTIHYPKLKDNTLFTKFKLNTEFMNIISGLFTWSYGSNYAKDSITSIDMDSIRFDNCKKVFALFGWMKGLKTIRNFKFNGANKLETINLMFADSIGIENIDISDWDLPSTCKNLDGFFSTRQTLSSIAPYSGTSENIKTITLPTDFERRVANVESFEAVFACNSGLTTINNLSLNMPKCKSFVKSFMDCRSLANPTMFNIQSTDKEPVDLNSIFFNCNKLSGVIDLSKVKYIKSIKTAFCSTGTNGSLSSIKFGPGVLNTTSNTSEKKMDKDALVGAFYQTKVNSIEHLEDLDAPEIESMKETFKGINGIRDINLPNFKMEGVKSLEGTFAWGYNGLRSIRIPKVEKLNPDITTMQDLFSAGRYIETLDFPPLTRQNNPQNTKKLTDLSGLLSGCSSLNIPIYITNLDTSNVTTLQNAFQTYNPQGTDIVGIEDLNTTNVKNFYNVFGSNIKNKSILDLRKWNVSKGINFYGIFNKISSEIDITGWDVSKLVYGRGFFAYMKINSLDKIKGLETLNFSSLKSGNPCYSESSNRTSPEYIMSELGGIDSMFSNTTELITFAIPNCLKNLPNITSLYEFFESCNRLQTADLTGCHYGTIKNIGRLCEYCFDLRTIDLTSLDFSIRCGAYAFKSCRNLREIKGTLVFDESITEDQSKYLLKDMFAECNSLSNVKVKNIPGNNKTLFESVTGIRSNQYTVVS